VIPLTRLRRGELLAPRRVLGLGAGSRWRSSDRFDQPTAPAPWGARTGDPLLLEIVVDESPSEYDADPLGHRHAAARRIVELLRTDLACSGDRVGVVHFADQPGPVLRPQDPHTRRGHRRLRRALQPPGTGTSTDVCAALTAAARLLPRRWPGATVILLMSDGYDGNTTDDLAAAVGRFPPRSVHVFSIHTPLPDTWADVPLGSVTVVPSATHPDAIEWSAAKVIYYALGVA
jgi:uncharacterized protein (DUF58 family)